VNRRVLVLSYTSMLVFALVFQAVPAILSLMVEPLGLSHTQAGLLMSLFALPGILVSIPGGMLADSFGSKKVGMYALALMAGGSFLSGISTGFATLAAGRLVAGAGAITLAIVAPQAITRWFDRSHVGRMMGLLNTAMPMGTVLAFNLLVRTGFIWGWRTPILFTSGSSILLLVLYWLLYPAEKEMTGKPDYQGIIASLRSVPAPAWVCALIWMAFNATAVSFLTFASDFYATYGYDAAYAGFITSLFMAGTLVLSFPVGYLTDRFGGEPAFIAVGATAMSFLLFLVPRTGMSPALLVALIGIAAALIPAPIFSLAPKLLNPGQTGTGFGMMSSFLNAGVLAGSFLVGMSYDKTGSHQRGFDLMAAFSLAVLIFVLTLASVSQRNYKKLL